MLQIQLLTVAHVVIYIGNKGDIHGSLKYCSFKTSNSNFNFLINFRFVLKPQKDPTRAGYISEKGVQGFFNLVVTILT